MKQLRGSNCTFSRQVTEIFFTNSKPQVACADMFVLLTSNHEVIGMIKDLGLPQLINIHEG